MDKSPMQQDIGEKIGTAIEILEDFLYNLRKE
jgi:hypothetical protein